MKPLIIDKQTKQILDIMSKEWEKQNNVLKDYDKALYVCEIKGLILNADYE